jgi:putative aldouronate transport system substrate-binding protein
LDDLIQQWAPELIDLFDPVLWSCATVNGKIYSIPAFWRDNSGDGEGKLAVRKDKFDEFGLPIPGSQEEALEVLPVLNEMWKAQDGVDRYVFEHSPGRCPVAFHRTYDSWPFYASQDGIFKVTQSAEASLYFESEEFKKDADFMNALFNLGLIHPDAMNLPNDVKSDIIAQRGDYLLCIMTPGANPITLERNGIMGAVNYSFVFEPEKPYLCNLPLLNSNGIPSTTKNPESALLFLNWLYSDPENQYLLLHGVEGLTWNRVGTDKYERIRNDQNQVLYAFDAWMIEYCTANHLWDVDDISTDLEKQDFMTNIYPDNTVYSPMVGFNFNSEPVSMELANMMSEYTASILPIKLGLLSYDGNFESAISKMKAAGCDRVIAEYQQQLNDYLASKN